MQKNALDVDSSNYFRQWELKQLLKTHLSYRLSPVTEGAELWAAEGGVVLRAP